MKPHVIAAAAALLACLWACNAKQPSRGVQVQDTFFGRVTLGTDMRQAMGLLYGMGMVDAATRATDFNADTIPDQQGGVTTRAMLVAASGQGVMLQGCQWASVELTGTLQELYSISFHSAELPNGQAQQACKQQLDSLATARRYPMRAMQIGTVQGPDGGGQPIEGYRYDNGTHLVQLHTSPVTDSTSTVVLTYLVKE